jgi:tRNA nucleotidyltransferase/poly(A) polymerase
MSDYMFMLENHLTSAQNRVLADIQAAAAEAGVNIFLVGGAMRDMLGGFPIRDLDFAVEGNSSKLAKALSTRSGAEITRADEVRKSYELVFPGGVTAEIAMSRQERYTKTGGKPHVTPAPIHDDLHGRDFTVNALALSLNRASRGLLIDPTNGLGDLERRELRTTGNYAFYDQPVRLLRLLRFKVRLGFSIAERTQQQYENARTAGVEKHIGPGALLEELRQTASEANPAEVLQLWEKEKLLVLISPALTGPKLNIPGFVKLHKARQAVPFGLEIQVDEGALFFFLLAEKLTPRERSALIAATNMDRETVDSWSKLEGKTTRLEKELASAKLQKPSQIYAVLSKVPAEHSLFLLIKSAHRVIHDRIRNYFGKYLPAALEITDLQVVEAGGKTGTPKFAKMKSEMIRKRLDSRPKRVPEPAPVEPAAPPPTGRARMSSPLGS